MLDIPGFKNIKKILWKEIAPGMVVIGGVQVNNALPFELQNFPNLTAGMIFELTNKYHFRPTKEILVAEVERGYSSNKMGLGFKTIETKIRKLNLFREKYLELKNQTGAGIDTDFFESDFFLEKENQILDEYNSISSEKKNPSISLFNSIQEKITLLDILTKSYKKKFKFPSELDFTLHILINYSNKTDIKTKLKYIEPFLELVYHNLQSILSGLKINLYAFSDICNLVKFPLGGREIERKSSKYNPMIKKLLHHRNLDLPNFVIVFSDSLPEDIEEAITNAVKLKKLKVDYMQILLSENYTRTDSDLNLAIGGSQIILKEAKFFSLAALHSLDRYLSANTKEEEKKENLEVKSNQVLETNSLKVKKEKVIKPFEFKKIQKKI
jgi:hypothetical protein